MAGNMTVPASASSSRAEEASYAQEVRIASCPVQEYLGLIFAYLGEGQPPPLPRYPRFEAVDISDVAALHRICNYFNNIDLSSGDGANVSARIRARIRAGFGRSAKNKKVVLSKRKRRSWRRTDLKS
jgi:hypothetical protein